MKLGERMVDGVFLERPNRYLARVVVDGKEYQAHVPDPGRLPGLMIPGRAVRLVHQPGTQRKTDYTLVLVKHGRIWVSVYPVFANKLVGDALSRNAIPAIKGFKDFRGEAKYGSSRFDFELSHSKSKTLVEVKSVSLVEKGVGKFPDAPTERGCRHVEELIHYKKKGMRSVVLFVSQRSDTRSITSNDEIDPRFGEVLRQAKGEGVQLLGYNCRVTGSAVTLKDEIPVQL